MSDHVLNALMSSKIMAQMSESAGHTVHIYGTPNTVDSIFRFVIDSEVVSKACQRKCNEFLN